MGFRSTENRRLQARHELGAAVASQMRSLQEALNELINKGARATVMGGFFDGSTVARVSGRDREFRLSDPTGMVIAEGQWGAVCDEAERIVWREMKR